MGSLLIGLGIGLAFILVYFLYVRVIDFVFSLPKFFKYSGWKSADGKITSMAPAEVGTRGPETAAFYRFLYEVKYTYSYDGKEYNGNDFLDYKPAADKPLILRVNPADAAKSIIYKYKKAKRELIP
ncbi:hypothetical protein AAIR98_001407 [Elusimicrobium simillimum]|uniref:hypothetical protein n=1 Tax=Elusimicrobium simillimum TaxID=3143438 RepID=UPI003C6EAC7D